MKKTIIKQLREIEEENDIKILYACESGSRAWGFPSSDSDYDVRFLYIHPTEWYLSIQNRRDVIEYPITDNLDINGWDLQKALNLLSKSNPPLMEWLGSPIVYIEEFTTARKMRELAQAYYSPTALSYHYLHMAQGNYREHLGGERVWLKKYLYALRPILAINWIENGLGVVPTEFEVLVEKLITEPELYQAIHALIQLKKAGEELDFGPRIDSISEYIDRELKRFENYQVEYEKPSVLIDKLDELFLSTLSEVWDSDDARD